MNEIALDHRRAASATESATACGPSSLPPTLRVTALAAATALALAALPDAALGQGIGPLDVRSRLGERVFAAVPVATPGRLLDPNCVRVLPNPNAPAGAQALEGVRVRVGSADTILIETVGTVTSPVVGLRLQVGCENPATRDFVVVEPSEAPATATFAEADRDTRREAAAVSTAPAPVVRTVAPPRASARVARATTTRSAPVAPRRTATARTAATAPSTASTPAPAPVAATNVETSAAASSDTRRRVAELRARSDDQAAALLELGDRLALLQKQAELVKAQLERALAAASVQSTTAAAADDTAGAGTTPATTASGAAGAQAGTQQAAAQAATTPPAAAPAAAASQQAPSVASAAAASPGASGTQAIAETAAERPGRNRTVLDLLLDWKVAGGLAALLAGAFAFTLRRRPAIEAEPVAAAVPLADDRSEPRPDELTATEEACIRTQELVQPLASPDDTADWAASPAPSQTAEWVPPPTTDSLPLLERNRAATLPGAAMTREFHITQQFRPDTERLVALSSPEEIVQQARTHYMDDNDVFKAIDLLEMAIAARTDSPRPWLALFAIYRRENMPERYQRLLLAYRDAFGQDENWPAICALGRQLDPANSLYADDAGGPAIPDDLIERWLGVPLDFTAHLLANEMHDELMSTYPGRGRRKRSAAP